jgi:hypothetical protein
MKVLLLTVLVALVSCGRGDLILVEQIGKDGISLVASNGVLIANSACTTGGNVTSIYQDIDKNGSVTLGIDKLQSTFITCNGIEGSAGATGSSSILTIIDLKHDICGQASSNFSEVIIKLADGRYLASFSDNVYGDNTRFTILVKNVNYSATDGSNCRFKIDNANNVVRI